MIGKWNGAYEYDMRNGFKNPNLKRVEFDIEIVSKEYNSFKGTVEDNIEMGGTPGVGQITGVVNDNTIMFEKNMPVEVMLLQNGESKVKNNKHPTLIYTGTITNDTTMISGTWKFKKLKFLWIGILPWWYDLGSGTFTMQKRD